MSTCEPLPSLLAWHNAQTGEYDYRADAPDTDEECRQYIPDNPIAHNLYTCYREIGFSPFEAMANTLASYVGEPEPIEIPGAREVRKKQNDGKTDTQ